MSFISKDCFSEVEKSIEGELFYYISRLDEPNGQGFNNWIPNKGHRFRTKKILRFFDIFTKNLNETLFSFFQSETVSRKKVDEYWVNKSLITKESEVFETMLSGVNDWEESMRFASGSNIDKFITVSDTKRLALEAYLVFCYSGYVPMSAIGQVTTSWYVFTNF